MATAQKTQQPNKPLSTAQKAGGISAGALAIIAAVVALEGGYVNNPKDPGGATNHGITEEVARANGYYGPMSALSQEFAVSIYYQDYMVKPGYVAMVDISPAVAKKLTDVGVNTGTGRSSRWFQTALNSVNRDGKDFPPINVDGKVGPGTYAAYNGLVRVRGKVQACEIVIKLLDAQQATHYMSLTNLKTFTPGWVMNRVGNVPLSQCSQ